MPLLAISACRCLQVCECRGLVLDEADDFAVLAFPFAKFFNLCERHAASTRAALDWPTARVYEKIDGSLLTLYFRRRHAAGGGGGGGGGRWLVASSKLPTAAGLLPGAEAGRSFAAEFWAAFAEAGMCLPSCTGCCYMFELTTPSHTIVVPHRRRRLRCLGARDLRTLQELPVEAVAAAYRWPTPPRFDELRTEAAVLEDAVCLFL